MLQIVAIQHCSKINIWPNWPQLLSAVRLLDGLCIAEVNGLTALMWQKYLLVRLLHLHGDFVNALAVVNNMIFVLVNIDLCQQTATWVNIVNKVAFFQYVMYSEIPLLLCVS